MRFGPPALLRARRTAPDAIAVTLLQVSCNKRECEADSLLLLLLPCDHINFIRQFRFSCEVYQKLGEVALQGRRGCEATDQEHFLKSQVSVAHSVEEGERLFLLTFTSLP